MANRPKNLFCISSLVISLDSHNINLLYYDTNHLNNLFIVFICFIVIIISFLVMTRWNNILDLKPTIYPHYNIRCPDYPNNRIVNISFKRMTSNNIPFIVIYDSNQITSARLKFLYPSNHWVTTKLEIDGVNRICLMMSGYMFNRYNTPIEYKNRSAIYIPRSTRPRRNDTLEIHSNHNPVIGADNKWIIIGQ